MSTSDPTRTRIPSFLSFAARNFLMCASIRFSLRPLATVTAFEWSVIAMYSCPSFRAASRHLFNRIFPVARRRMHLQVALHVPQLNQLRQFVLFRGGNLSCVFPQLRRDVIQLQLPVNLLLSPSRDMSFPPSTLPTAYSFSVQPMSFARPRSATLCSFEPVK